MTRRRDPSCLIPGEPCARVTDDLLIEMARVQAREEVRPPIPCRRCGERNRIALGGAHLCYRCKAGHETEGDHVAGSGSGPSVLHLDSNINRIGAESERIWRQIRDEDLCRPCIFGFGNRLGILLSRLEVGP